MNLALLVQLVPGTGREGTLLGSGHAEDREDSAL